ncbi:MAG: DegV family protein [Butyrivibrio sp.]
MAVKILCDSSADLSIEEIKAMDLLYVPIPVIFGDKTYIEGTNITKDEYYNMLENNPEFPTTSQPSPAEFLDLFEEAAEKGDEIVAILISETLSGTFQNANLAKNMAAYDKIYLIDSFNLAASTRILIETAVKLRDEGCAASLIADKINELKHRTHIYAALDTLENLYRGGRLTRAAAGIGELAKLKPVVTLNEEAKVAVCHKAIGKNKACNYIIKLFDKTDIDENYPVYFIYSKDSSNAEMLKSRMSAAGYPTDNCKSYNLGPVLATHVGVGVFGIAFVEK